MARLEGHVTHPGAPLLALNGCFKPHAGLADEHRIPFAPSKPLQGLCEVLLLDQNNIDLHASQSGTRHFIPTSTHLMPASIHTQSTETMMLRILAL